MFLQTFRRRKNLFFFTLEERLKFSLNHISSRTPHLSGFPPLKVGVSGICVLQPSPLPLATAGVNVTMPAQPGMPPLSSTQLQIDTALQEFQLVDLSRRFLVHDSFWALPEQFLGNKVRAGIRIGPSPSPHAQNLPGFRSL